ncbi:hypothetical protein NKDENANG_00867 [Candidatus Entotheonellaceae bacterium PAL068K]
MRTMVATDLTICGIFLPYLSPLEGLCGVS